MDNNVTLIKNKINKINEINEIKPRFPKIDIKKERGYHYRIVSDNEYKECLAIGYEEDLRYDKIRLGNKEYGTVMRIKQEIFDQHQKNKEINDEMKFAKLQEKIRNSGISDYHLSRTNVSINIESEESL